jgi:hypothetical protein
VFKGNSVKEPNKGKKAKADNLIYAEEEKKEVVTIKKRLFLEVGSLIFIVGWRGEEGSGPSQYQILSLLLSRKFMGGI